MMEDRILLELGYLAKEEREAEKAPLDERWDRLAAGTLTPEEDAELRALAESSPETRETYEAFRPLGAKFQARVVKEIAGELGELNTVALVRKALAGDQTALTRLVALLTPVIQARVARKLLARRSLLGSDRNVRQEVEDLTQDIFLSLFAKDARVLRSWEAERGLSLENFVGLVSERYVVSFFRSDKRNHWKEELSLLKILDGPSTGLRPDEVAAIRELLRLLLERLREELSPLGYHLFELLFVEDLSLKETMAASGLSAVAVYAWRSRLRRLAKKIHAELSGKSAPARKSRKDGAT
jgi:RNA polymerase sigma-70 factor, ECF subfamily